MLIRYEKVSKIEVISVLNKTLIVTVTYFDPSNMSDVIEGFQKVLNEFNCQHLVHPWTRSCWKHSKVNLGKTFQEIVVIYAPIMFVRQTVWIALHPNGSNNIL